MASLILGNIGTSLLGPIGGFIGSAVGSAIDQFLFAPTPPDIEGPRVEDLTNIAANPGTPIPLVYGADRIPGIVVHTTDLIETAHTQRVGGKGGGGQKQTTYTYHVDITFMLCEGPILGVGRIWADGKLLRGTRYQMELDTEENFEKIGGIPYNDWYLDNIYVAEDLYWTSETDVNPNIGTQDYQYNSSTDQMVPISAEFAEQLLTETKEVVYRVDNSNGLFIPVSASHTYTGEVLEEGVTSDLVCISAVAELPTFSVPNSRDDGEEVLVTLDLVALTEGLIISDIDNRSPDNVFGYATLTQPVTSIYVEENGPFPDFGWSVVNAMTMASGILQENGEVAGFPGSSASDLANTATPGTDGGNPVDPVMNILEGSVTLFAGDDTLLVNLESARALAFNNRLEQGPLGVVTISGCAPIIEQEQVRNWEDYYNFYDAINDWSPKAVLEFHGADDVTVYRGYPDQPVDPIMQANSPTGDSPAYICKATVTFDRLELEQFGNRIPNLTFEVVQSDNARVADVLTDLMERSGVDPSNYDIADVPTTGDESFVLGYTVAKITSYRAAMEPMMEAFRLDVAEIGSELVFRPKRRAAEHTIDWNDLDAATSGGDAGSAIRLAFRDAVEMPRTLGLRFKDPEREYQPSTASFQRQIGRSVQQSVIELGVVLQPYRMKSLVRDKMRDLWFERQSGAWTLPHKYLYISPSDFVSIVGSPNGTYDDTYKVTQVTRRSDGILEMEGVKQEATPYTAQDGQYLGASTDVLFESQNNYGYSSLTHIQVHDLPPLITLEEAEDFTIGGVIIGVGGTNGRWPGATIYEDTMPTTRPDVVEEEVEQWSAASVMGQLLINGETSSNFLNNQKYGGVDYDSEIYVYLYSTNHVLESITADELWNGKNACVIGGEIVQFQRAELQDDGSYKLTRFLRGRLDTEDFSTTHGPLEEFMLLNEETSLFTQVSSTFNNETLRYWGITYGNTFADLNTYDVNGEVVAGQTNYAEKTYGYRRLKPFRPVQIQGVRDGSNNLTITWRRQDRYGNTLIYEETDIPITEDTTQTYMWEVDIYYVDDTSDPRNPVAGNFIKTVQLAAMPDASTSYEYTAADQTTDGITPGDLVYVEIFQMSALVGRGNKGTGTL